MIKKSVLLISIISMISCTSKEDYKNASLPVERRVQSLLSQMTLEEKVAQLYTSINGQIVQDNPDGFDLDSATKYMPHGTGFYFVWDPNLTAAQFVERINRMQTYFVEHTRLGIPAFIGAEGLHGFVANGATQFPQSIALGGTFDRQLIEKIYTVAAREMRSWGVNQVLSPNVDLGRDPRFGRIEETYSEDPYLVAQLGLHAVWGFQGRTEADMKNNRVVATLKHYAGHGEPQGGRNIAPVQSESTREMRDTHLYPFEVCVKQGNALSVMASYNESDGVPNHANKKLLREILLDEFGFDGYVIGDLGGVEEMLTLHRVVADEKEAAEVSFKAGVDLELVKYKPNFDKLVQLVAEGRVPESLVDEAVAKILRIKFQLGLFEQPYANAQQALAQTNTTADKALALEAAQKSMVLLKNDNNLLPLDAGKLKKVAVIGPMADSIHLGGYSYEPRSGVSIRKGIEAYGNGKYTTLFAEGCRITHKTPSFWGDGNPIINTPEEDARLMNEAVAVAKQADVVILAVGENENYCREAWSETHLGDRESLELPGRQNELAARLFETGKPVVVLITGGRPLSFNLINDKAPAIFQAWYLGEETGHAVASVLFGEVNPSAKLSVTIPRSVGQLPCYYNHKPSRFRSYLDADSSPLYPFGYGLSYTTFSYSKPSLSQTEITPDGETILSVNITNTGTRAGDEVVQLYLRDVVSSVSRPVLELCEFARVSLKPGETKTVSFNVGPEQLQFYNVAMQRVVEPGVFELTVGPSSVQGQKTELRVVKK